MRPIARTNFGKIIEIFKKCYLREPRRRVCLTPQSAPQASCEPNKKLVQLHSFFLLLSYLYECLVQPVYSRFSFYHFNSWQIKMTFFSEKSYKLFFLNTIFLLYTSCGDVCYVICMCCTQIQILEMMFLILTRIKYRFLCIYLSQDLQKVYGFYIYYEWMM